MIPAVTTPSEELTTVVLTGITEAGSVIGDVLNKVLAMLGAIYIYKGPLGSLNLLWFFVACAVIVLIEEVIFVKISADWGDDSGEYDTY